MRKINNDALPVPNEWQVRCNDAKCKLAAGQISPDDRQQIWKDMKDALAERSHDKCWYCEIVQERSDNNVDHFRPKALYPWLAFELSNFRYACTYCNSRRKNPETGETGGKGDQFPLADESKRAEAEGGEDDESPLLLDPCRPQDPGLLDFRDDGRPCAKYPDHARRRLRAETSIRCYHLDSPALVEKRRELAAKLTKKIKQADKLIDRCDCGDPGIDNAFNALIADLSDAIAEKAELSTVAKKVISGSRDKEWVEDILRTG
jgi:uncharacterized protein (TIGR02646 family)